MNTKTISNLTFSVLLIMCANACTAQGYETWTEKMTCGEAQYKLVSVCKKSNEEFTLNDCKPQTLEITNKGNVRKVTLPELSKFDTNLYKKEGGNLNELFVTQWGCGQFESKKVASLYYSIGGGNFSTAESSASYDEVGVIIQHEHNKIYDKAMNNSFSNLKPVRSIMPE